MSPKITDPLQVGPCALKHRLVMAPMTRLRADNKHVPQDMVCDYYAQRASVPGTLLITEATFISSKSRGRGENAPGIFTDAQIQAWQNIAREVHNRGSFIFMQLWHVGRAARAQALAKAGGVECVSSSDISLGGEFPNPRPMTDDEIIECIQSFATAAQNAIAAGFDGVEIHAANGYLIDQFTQDTCNRRTDRWGGNIENRSRFCLEVATAVVAAIGGERTAIRLSPFSDFQGMRMTDPKPQFTHLVTNLRSLGLAYLHLIEPTLSGNTEKAVADDEENLDFALEAWQGAGPIIFAGGYSREKVDEALVKNLNGGKVGFAIGRPFISNPDLPFRLFNNVPVRDSPRECWYDVNNAKGYSDFSFSQEWEEAQKTADSEA